MSDLNLRKNILEELEFQPEIDAERAAWSVPGVGRVEDHLLLA
ncbi:hypothetical protein [Pseudomonas koreensis]|nr:hypothetical protein [Pseudomonas koreensis]